VKDHTGNPGNEGAHALANLDTQCPLSDNIKLSIPNRWNVTGVKLWALTQALAYLGVRATREQHERRGDVANLTKTYHYIYNDLSQRYHTQHHIWTALRHKDVTKKVSNFLWKVMHDALRIGKYWTHNPVFESHAICDLCNEEESIDHVLTDCVSNECKHIWAFCTLKFGGKELERTPAVVDENFKLLLYPEAVGQDWE
jgi:hypothetical protein